MTTTKSETKNSTSRLTPKLRFPEFRDGPGWAGKPMGEVYSFMGNNSLSRDQLNYEHGSVKNIHYGDIHTKFSTLFDITRETVPLITPSVSLDGFRPENDCVEGDMIFADASEDLEDVGKSIELVRLDGQRVVAGQHTILARPNDESLVVGFAAYLFKSKRVRTQIQKESQGAKVLGISATRLTKIELPIPSTQAEQRKIASCLSSLDELIGVESRKLGTLKAHKKGLMQQLFPREGETQPRLRFPELRKTKIWVAKRLGDIGDVLMCKRIFSNETNNQEGVPFYKIGTLGGKPDAFITKKLFDDYRSRYSYPRIGEVLITCSGTVGKCVSFDGRDAYYQDSNIVWIDNRKQEVSNEFLLFILENVNWRILNSTTITRIYGPDLKGLSIQYPADPREQQRIVTCLSSLDYLITAQNEKIDALKHHKKGLMQQLFPSREGLS